MWDLNRMVALGLLVDPYNFVEGQKSSRPGSKRTKISAAGVVVDKESFRGMVGKWQQLLAHINETDNGWAWYQN